MQCLSCEGFGLIPVHTTDQTIFCNCPVCAGDGILRPGAPAPRGQSRAWSFGETCFSTAIGLVIALLTQMIVFPWFGLHVSFAQDVVIAAIFTVVSVVRGYFVRRLFEAWR